MQFVHLHTHSEYSLLDGAARLDHLVSRAAELEMPALALTDHGVMHGSVDFYNKCKTAGIKPILGVEAYVAPGDHKDRTPRADGKQAYHLLLLAKNLEGYKNLLKLTTIAAIEGFYYKPRIDHALLAQYKEGILATSACLGGEVCQALLKGHYEQARDIAGMYRDMLGPDNYYIEIQNHTIQKQIDCNEQLLKIAKELKLNVLCTNDVHYLNQKDAQAHDVLLCIGKGTTVDDPKRMRYEADQFYMKSQQEMLAAFDDFPAALEQTIEIADRCDLNLEFGRAPLPTPKIPDGHTAQSYLAELAHKGLHDRLGMSNGKYADRLNYELGIVEQTGFAQYILIVRDFALFAREKGIIFGVRGSAAGSLTSYCVEITDIDPVEYELTFERFLNPERAQMPDIDMDFEDARRAEVLDYVTKKYGEDRVAQIVTFGTMAARAALKDSGRALGMPIPDVNKVVSMIPTMPLGITLKQAMDANPDFRTLYVRDPDVKKLVDTAQGLEGIARHASVHAAGVIICDEPLVNYTPLQKNADGALVTQYPAGALEKIGLLKMDFLGLINLSILGRSVENIQKSRGETIDVKTIPLDDKKAFDMLARGETTGIFQLESAGMRRYIAELKPTSVRDLAAMVALYRPGPMAHIPTFIRAKHGMEKIKYPHPKLEDVLSETYGVIVYQDQVMLIAQAIAGYSLGQADILRRAMGKKKKEEMAKERKNFVAGAEKQGIPSKKAAEIFDLIEPFAGYAFNKAHAVCYAMVAYQTAYLKANYPAEYMSALLTCYLGKPDKVASCMDECGRMKLIVLPPDVNLSGVDFTAEATDRSDQSDGSDPTTKGIRFGMAGIKNVGRGAVDAILEVRQEGGPFTSLYDFCSRTTEHGAVTRSTIESLIRCGALSSLHGNRRALIESLESAIQIAARRQRSKEIGQGDLFIAEGSDLPDEEIPMPDIPDYDSEEILAHEKDLLGLYISDHPLKKHRALLEKNVSHTVTSLAEIDDRTEVTIGGIISSVKRFTAKKSGEPMAFLTLEDFTGAISITMFPSVYRDFSQYLIKDSIAVVRGRITRRERVMEEEDGERTADAEILADSLKPLQNGVSSNGNGNGHYRRLNIRLDELKKLAVPTLRRLLEERPGDAAVCLHVIEGQTTITKQTRIRVAVDDELIRNMEQALGRQSHWLD